MDEHPQLFVGFHFDGVVETCDPQPINPTDVAYVPAYQLKDLCETFEVIKQSRRDWKAKAEAAEARIAELERERDEARAQVEEWADGCVEANDRAERAEHERDEARERAIMWKRCAYDVADDALKRTWERLEDRDEAMGKWTGRDAARGEGEG